MSKKSEHHPEPEDIPGILPLEFAKELSSSDSPYRGTLPNDSHGPQNAEHELRKAYCDLIQADLVQKDDMLPEGKWLVDELNRMYKHAFRKYRDHHLLSAERWAHSVRHLAKAIFFEFEIAFIEQKYTDFPHLIGATAEDYNLKNQKMDTVEDLLNSVADHIPPGLESMPQFMVRCLNRAREHLQKLNDSDYHHELLRAERIKAAYHYGRLLEVMGLAYEADLNQIQAA